MDSHSGGGGIGQSPLRERTEAELERQCKAITDATLSKLPNEGPSGAVQFHSTESFSAALRGPVRDILTRLAHAQRESDRPPCTGSGSPVGVAAPGGSAPPGCKRCESLALELSVHRDRENVAMGRGYAQRRSWQGLVSQQAKAQRFTSK